MSQTRLERPQRPSSRIAGVTRLGLRVVVVAGIAGAAWVLSASPAQAADSANTTTASAGDRVMTPLAASVLDLLGNVTAPVSHAGTRGTAAHASTATGTGSVLAPVDGVLTTATAPLMGAASSILHEVLAPTNTVLPTGTGASAEAAGAVRTTAPTTVARLAVAPSAKRAPGVIFGIATRQVAPHQPDGSDGVSRNGAAYVGSADLVRTVSDIVSPLGLDDLVQPSLDMLQPMIGLADPVLSPLADVLRLVTSAARWLAVPLTSTVGSVVQPVTAVAWRSTVGLLDGVAGRDVAAHASLSSATPSRDAGSAVDAATIATTPVRVEAGTSALRTYDRAGTRGTPATRHDTDGVGGRSLPSLPQPLPALPVQGQGAIPTTASGSHGDGGAFAILSTPVAACMVARQRKRAATGVVARRLIVEAPTVSPD